MTIAACKQFHPRILLLSDEKSSDGSKEKEETSGALGTSLQTVERVVRQRFAEEGLGRAINPKPKTLDGAGESFLVATTCSKAPEEQPDWKLQLLEERLVECNKTESIRGNRGFNL